MSKKEVFLNSTFAILDRHLGDANFGVAQLGDEIGISRVHLYRKIKTLTDSSVSAWIRQKRLYRAAQLLLEGNDSVAHISRSVGFSNFSYFSKCFRVQFGICPSRYRNLRRPRSQILAE